MKRRRESKSHFLLQKSAISRFLRMMPLLESVSTSELDQLALRVRKVTTKLHLAVISSLLVVPGKTC